MCPLLANQLGFLPDNYWTLAVIVLPVATVYASVIDYAQRRVPNWLNAALAVLGICAQFSYFGLSGAADAVLGLLAGFGLLIVPWMMHGMGAGDVKLMAAIGAWMGPWLVLLGFLLGVLIGGAISIVMIISNGTLRRTWTNLGVIVTKCRSGDTIFSEFGSVKSFAPGSALLPYGIPLTIGSLIILAGRFLQWPALL